MAIRKSPETATAAAVLRGAASTPAVNEDGTVAISAVLDIIRPIADAEGWCSDAEARVIRYLGNPEGLRFKSSHDACRCESCPSAQPFKRFEPVEGSPETVSLATLKLGVRGAVAYFGSDYRVQTVANNLIAAFDLDNVAVSAAKSWKISFTLGPRNSVVRQEWRESELTDPYTMGNALQGSSASDLAYEVLPSGEPIVEPTLPSRSRR